MRRPGSAEFTMFFGYAAEESQVMAAPFVRSMPTLTVPLSRVSRSSPREAMFGVPAGVIAPGRAIATARQMSKGWRMAGRRSTRGLFRRRWRPPNVEFLKQLPQPFRLGGGKIRRLPGVRLQVVELRFGLGAIAGIRHDEL